MPDMIVRLYDLPDSATTVAEVAQLGVIVREADLTDRDAVVAFVAHEFAVWEKEVVMAFEESPSLCFVAIHQDQVVGFAAYDVASRNFFGPTGVAPKYCRQGIGKALLLVTLEAQARQGYAYAIIGGVGPQGFYRKCVGAQLIEGSSPGIYVSASST